MGLQVLICTEKQLALLVRVKLAARLQGLCTALVVNLTFDTTENELLKKDFGAAYVDLKTLCNEADIISLHLPLNKQTKHIISKESIAWMKKGMMLINTSRGGLVDTLDVVEALKSRHIGYFGIDVYEEEEGLFFEDHSLDIL